jgi:hypothetical protein
MERPFGVTLLAVLAVLSGLWGLLKGLAIIGIGGAAAVWVSPAHPMAGAVVGGLAMAWGVTAIILACFSLGFGFGAWNLKPWAWTLGVATEVGAIIFSLLAAAGWGTLRGQAGALLVAGVILFYLTTPEVKRAFGKSA